MTSTAVQRPRAPLPIPDNAKAWATVLGRALTEIGERRRVFVCNAIARCVELGQLSHYEAAALRSELAPFLDNPGNRYGLLLTEAAQYDGAWPADLDSRFEPHRDQLRLRFIRWRAGLPIGGPLPWADDHTEA